MTQNPEKLAMELIQAQMLLRASHDLYEDILVQAARCKLADCEDRRAKYQREIDARIAKFANRDTEIRRMLVRLENATAA